MKKREKKGEKKEKEKKREREKREKKEKKRKRRGKRHFKIPDFALPGSSSFEEVKITSSSEKCFIQTELFITCTSCVCRKLHGLRSEKCASALEERKGQMQQIEDLPISLEV